MRNRIWCYLCNLYAKFNRGIPNVKQKFSGINIACLFFILLAVSLKPVFAGNNSDSSSKNNKQHGEVISEYAQAKANYLAAKAPEHHDFSKLNPNVPHRQNHLIVRFTSDSKGGQRTAGEKQNVINSLGGGVVKRNISASRGLCLVELPENLTVEEALEIYNARDDILYAEPDYEVKALSAFPNDTRFSELWGMHNTGQLGGTTDADIDAPEVWDIKTNADNIIVAVIDTGVDYTHEDLAQNMWKNQAEFNGTTGVDDDGNGYIDDIYGYDFAYYDADPMDVYSHGTHCAGTIGAVGNNGKGVAGVCWNVKIMAVKFLDDTGSGWTDDAIRAVQYATMMGAKVLSNSWGGGEYSQGLKDAIDAAAEAGVLFVAAAGNSGGNNDTSPFYPSSYTSDNIISVMATDMDDVRSIWPEYEGTPSSCYGATSVDIAAPGTDILSCIPGNQYAYYDGTSMATPHVSGACALVWSMNPGMTYTQVKNTIFDKADRLTSLDGLCATEARLNVFKAIPLELTITSDVSENDCLGIDEDITFTIYWHNPTGQTFYNVSLVDVLPNCLDYPVSYSLDPNTYQMVSSDPNYNEAEHCYAWSLGTVYPNDSDTVQLTVYLNEKSEPGMKFINTVELRTDDDVLAYATIETQACCWDTIDPNIIYVDKTATSGNQTGVDWANAYTDLQDALNRAQNSSCQQNFIIYVAQGSYSPGIYEWNTFKLSPNVSLYGGFKTGGCDFNQRKPKLYPTILTGHIDSPTHNGTVVTMGDNSILDGFTITGAAEYGVYGTGADFTIGNCIVENSDGYGIYSTDGNATIKWCKIYGSQFDGVYHRGSHYTLNVENSWVLRNGEYGIYVLNSTPNIKNSIISESDLSEKGRQGIRIINPTYSPVLHNNTIANNKGAGISFVDNANASNDPNFKDYPDVQNCIVYYNNNGGPQFAGVNPDLVANFCCIQDCNTVNTNNFNDEPGFAYTVDPNGIPDPNNYHLSAGSFCVDRGNPDPAMGYASQLDYDNEARQYGDRVDVGADEVYNCDDEYLSQADVYNALDWNADGMVNLKEFTKFSAAWLTYDATHPLCDPNTPGYVAEPNEPGYIGDEDKLRYNPQCDLDKDLHVGLSDFMLFCEDWLWVACWKLEEINAAAAQTESMLAQSLSSARSLSVCSLDASIESAKTQPEVSAATLIQILEFLNSVATEESNNTAGIEEVKAILLAELQSLQGTETQ